MFQNVVSVFRALWLLGHPEFGRILGELYTSVFQIEQIVKPFPGAKIHHDVLVQGWPQGKLLLGKNVRIEKGSMLVLGDDFNGYGSLEIGEGTWIGQYNNFRLADAAHIKIGSECLISQFCSLVAANHRLVKDTPIKQAPCDRVKINIEVGNDVWIGAGAVITPGVRIETGAVIGANSVVTHSVPSWEIWAGAPAKKIGCRK